MLAQEERMLKEALDNSLAEAQPNPGARAAQVRTLPGSGCMTSLVGNPDVVWDPRTTLRTV